MRSSGRRLGRWRGLTLVLAGLVLLWALLPALLRTPPVSCSVADAEASPSDLVVLLHAFGKTSGSLDDLRRAVKFETVMPGADVLMCDLPFGIFSMAEPEDVVAELLGEIDRAWSAKSSYRRLRLVGHSMGALFARKAYVVASGETKGAPFEVELESALAGDDWKSDSEDGPDEVVVGARDWAAAVDRIVLMAGMNRGWSISHHLSIKRAVELYAGVAAGEVLEKRFGRLPLIFAVRRGAPFITNLRIQWLEMRRRARCEEGTAGGATTAQLLGSIDDLVSPEDNIDLISGRDFFYLDVERSGHASVIEVDLEEPPPESTSEQVRARAVEKERGRVFKLALTGTVEELRDEQVLEAGSELEALAQCDPQPPAARIAADDARQEDESATAAVEQPWAGDAPVTDVVFVIHGIRDEGHWTQKIARRVEARARDSGKRVVPEPSSYGYFPMLPFLRGSARRAKVEWLMDRYTEARARYPQARFHYVGHSNGTYLLAKALETYPSVRFERVVFVGSVVRTDYSWKEALQRDQVQAVLNFVASGDWVVAFFPKALELADFQDLGSAGHDGFLDAQSELGLPASKRVFQPEMPRDGEYVPAYVSGGHSEALDEAFWDSIAQFIIDDEIPEDFSRRLTRDEELRESFVEKRVGLVRFLGDRAPLLWLLLACVLGAILYGLVKLPLREWQRTLIVLGYLFLIWTVLTRI